MKWLMLSFYTPLTSLNNYEYHVHILDNHILYLTLLLYLLYQDSESHLTLSPQNLMYCIQLVIRSWANLERKEIITNLKIT